MIPDEAVQIAVSLHGAEGVVDAICWAAIRVAAILAAAHVGHAIIRAVGR